MSILSFEFLLLAAGVTIVYYLLPLRLRWMALLSGSAAFLLLSGWQSAAHLSAAALDNPGRRGHNQKKFLQIFKLRRNRT